MFSKLLRKTAVSGSAGVRLWGRRASRPLKSGRFRGLDRHSEIKITSRSLPIGARRAHAYFVTFRLADAVPAKLLRNGKKNWKRG